MKPNRRVLVIATACIAVGLMSYLVFRTDEPSYHGKRLSWWVNGHASLAQRNESIDAIDAIGTNALPYLCEWVVYEQPKPRRSALLVRVIGKLPQAVTRRSWVDELVAWWLRDKKEIQAKRTVVVFQMLGPTARSAIPRLIEIVRDKGLAESSERASEAICAIGEEGFSALFAVLPSLPQPRRGRVASHLLEYLQGHAKQNGLMQTDLAEISSQTANSKAIVLRELANEEASAIRMLTQSLDAASSTQVRYAAAEALGRFGAKAEVALPKLAILMTNSEPRLRLAASNALIRIQSEIRPWQRLR